MSRCAVEPDDFAPAGKGHGLLETFSAFGGSWVSSEKSDFTKYWADKEAG